MKRNLVLFVVLSILALASCKATVMSQVIWETHPELSGPIPTGHWLSVKDVDFEDWSASNSGASVYWIEQRSLKSDAVSFHEDGVGYYLARHHRDGSDGRDVRSGIAPENGFLIEGSELVYVRDAVFRWTLTDEQLILQGTRNRYHLLRHVRSNVLRFYHYRAKDESHYFEPTLLLRIGSSEYRSYFVFMNCVRQNGGKNLFSIDPCPIPWRE